MSNLCSCPAPRPNYSQLRTQIPKCKPTWWSAHIVYSKQYTVYARRFVMVDNGDSYTVELPDSKFKHFYELGNRMLCICVRRPMHTGMHLYIGWSDVTESMVTKRSAFCGYNTIIRIIRWVKWRRFIVLFKWSLISYSLRKCPYDHWLANKAKWRQRVYDRDTVAILWVCLLYTSPSPRD